MINLLSDESKKEIRSARSNVTLLNYLLFLGMGIIFLALISVGVYFVLTTTQSDAERLINLSKSKSSSYLSAETQGTALRAGLTNAKTILDQEVVYTKIITSIAALMPAGVVLDSLNLSPATIGAPTTMQFYAKTTKDALALKDKLQTSALFSNISFQTLSSTGQAADYPVSATLKLTINKSASK
jgi:Tfp pilus assembly protein PilN